MKGGTLDQQAVDEAIVMAPESVPMIADALISATQDFIETLQTITECRGADHENDFERAFNALAHQQKLACEALRRHGFEPRRTNLD
jgi:hypothetical protein